MSLNDPCVAVLCVSWTVVVLYRHMVFCCNIAVLSVFPQWDSPLLVVQILKLQLNLATSVMDGRSLLKHFEALDFNKSDNLVLSCFVSVGLLYLFNISMRMWAVLFIETMWNTLTSDVV
ncbi:hypothetical protein OTU49_007152 [Cherax quadricarinatus]|uniref:Uncharacterized protein n=1 Tax=Cherax quadricarinatus TaxID=27406 RepID=A0AAW0WX64_CHEQU